MRPRAAKLFQLTLQLTIGSGMEDALFLLLNISRPQRLIERNKVS
jgi:hypothetical protein